VNHVASAKKHPLWVEIALSCLALLFFLGYFFSPGTLQGDANLVQGGMTEAEVTWVLGTPGKLCAGSPRRGSWYAKEWSNSHEWLMVEFDEEGKVCMLSHRLESRRRSFFSRFFGL
jgi:hypothetical protein